MVWALRVLVAVIVAGYAGWLAWPLVEPFRVEAAGDAWRSAASVAWSAPAPQAAFWIVAVGFYLASASLTLIGSGRAALFFLIGFMTEVLLRLTVEQHGPGGAADINGRLLELFHASGLGGDPIPLSLAALAILGFVVFRLDLRMERSGGRTARPGRRSKIQALPESSAA